MNLSLDDKVALVTGASRGIGRAGPAPDFCLLTSVACSRKMKVYPEMLMKTKGRENAGVRCKVSGAGEGMRNPRSSLASRKVRPFSVKPFCLLTPDSSFRPCPARPDRLRCRFEIDLVILSALLSVML